MDWDDDWDKLDNAVCQNCGNKTVFSTGREKSKYAIVVSTPDDGDYDRVLQGARGSILKEEILRMRFDPKSFFYTSLWKHPPNKDEKCFALGVEAVIKEIKDKTHILLVGAETVKYFSGMSIEKCNGLVVQSVLLPNKLLIACVDPNTIFSLGIGEFRFAIQNFLKEIEK